MPVVPAAQDAPGLLVGRRRRHADGLERFAVAVRALAAEWFGPLAGEEELVRRGAAGCRVRARGCARCRRRPVADGDDGRDGLVAADAAEAGRERAARERPAEPAGAEAERRGVEDDLLEQVAVVLEVARPLAHGAEEEARAPLMKP